jgi:hypothetical protein
MRSYAGQYSAYSAIADVDQRGCSSQNALAVDLVHTRCRFALLIWISRAERQTPGGATLRAVLAER